MLDVKIVCKNFTSEKYFKAENIADALADIFFHIARYREEEINLISIERIKEK